jgi:hypothetical protein
MSEWNQPICDRCWRLREPERQPVRMVAPSRETCAFCGESTKSGILVRHDPREVPYPRVESA